MRRLGFIRARRTKYLSVRTSIKSTYTGMNTERNDRSHTGVTFELSLNIFRSEPKLWKVGKYIIAIGSGSSSD